MKVYSKHWDPAPTPVLFPHLALRTSAKSEKTKTKDLKILTTKAPHSNHPSEKVSVNTQNFQGPSLVAHHHYTDEDGL